MAEAAPYFAELADGPESGHAVWTHAADGVRIRVGLWPCEGATGTVLIFPGRTEYVEKYGRAARDLAQRGLASMAIDWRGQGLADRLTDNPLTGHVLKFRDYQSDARAALDAARAAGLPEPYLLAAHSMGGCIGLRSLHEGLPVKAAAFSAPMWGLLISAAVRPVAWALSFAATGLGRGTLFAPGVARQGYFETTPFDDNMLTRDAGMYAYMSRQVEEQPGLALAGPSLQWLREALVETRRLAAMPAPDVRTVTVLGTHERIVDAGPIHAKMAEWPDGRLELEQGAEHEIMMELPEVRARFFDTLARLARD